MAVSSAFRSVAIAGCVFLSLFAMQWAAAAQDPDASPRLGKYRVFLRGSQYSTLELLPNGKYKAYDLANAPLGDGEYIYDAKEKRVRWVNGRYMMNGYGGSFTVRDNGKKHVIRLTFITEAINEK